MVIGVRFLWSAAAGLLLGIGAAMTAALPAVASYSASSPYVFTRALEPDGGGTQYCGRGQAKIGDARNPGDVQSFTRSARWNPTSCKGTDALAKPAGWIGAKANGYRDGNYCGSTPTVYSGTRQSLVQVGQVVCVNPPGTQNFQTWNTSYIRQNTCNCYFIGHGYSPIVSY